MLHLNFKVDEETDPEIAEWLKSFNSKSRIRSYHIRQALKMYIDNQKKCTKV